MAFVADVFKRLLDFRRPKAEPNMEQRVSWLLRPYANSISDVLTWKNKFVSVCCVIGINLLLWLIRRWDVRPLGLIAGILLLLVILDGMATALGAGKNLYRERPSKNNNGSGEQLMHATIRARQWLSVAYADMLQLREQNPHKFCFIICCGFGFLCFVAKMGGALLVHALVNLAFLTPLLPNIQKTIKAIQSQGDSDGEVEEFLPELSTHVMEELQRAGDFHEASELPSLTSVDLSLPPDSSLLFAAAEGQSSEEDDDDFIETRRNDKSKTSTPSLDISDSSDSDSDRDFIPKDIHKNISIKRIVPNESQKASEASRLLTDAQAKNVTNSKVNMQNSGWIPFLMNAAGSYIKTPWSAPVRQISDSDSDEFELIDKNDL